MPSVIALLDQATRAVISHLEVCEGCAQAAPCKMAEGLWQELSRRHMQRLMACVKVQSEKAGRDGQRDLIRKLTRIADVLSGKEKLKS